MATLARKTVFRREILYRALSPKGNPESATFLKKALKRRGRYAQPEGGIGNRKI